MKQEWTAAYYPSDLVQDQKSRTLFCLLYDKVICHFPVSSMACGGGHGISGEFSDDPLVEAGVIELREEFLLDEIEGDFSPGYYWGTDEEFNRYYELNVTGMALQCYAQEGAIPVTDRERTPIPVSILPSFDLQRAARVQAGALAIQSVAMVLPAFAELTSNEILEARDRLKEQLLPFRSAMLALAPRVRSGISSNAPIAELNREAKYIVETDVLPRLTDLNRRLALERGTFWRKLIQKAGGNLPGIALKWISGAGISAAIDAIEVGSDLAKDAIDNSKLAHELLSNGGLGYLVTLQSTIGKKTANNGC